MLLDTTAAPVTRPAARAWPVTARLGVAGMAGFLGASIVTGALNPGYSPAREAVSALAATDARFAWIMIAGFLISSVGMIATGIGLWRRFAGVTSGRVAAVMAVICGSLMAVAALARQDCSERLPSCIDHGAAPLASTHFWVHQYSALLLFVLLTVSIFVLGRAVRRVPGLGHLAWPVRLAGIWGVLCIAELMVDPPALNGVAGLVQRAFYLVIYLTPVLVAGLPARRGA